MRSRRRVPGWRARARGGPRGPGRRRRTGPVTATVNIVIKSLYACAHQCGFCHVLHVPRNISYMPTAQVKETFDRIEEMFEGRRVEGSEERRVGEEGRSRWS